MCRCVTSLALLCVSPTSMLDDALALPPTQLCSADAFTPNLMSDLLSCLTASEISSSSVSDFSALVTVSSALSNVFSTTVFRVWISSSSTVAPGLSQTWLTGEPRKVSNSKKYWRNRWTMPIGERPTRSMSLKGSNNSRGSLTARSCARWLVWPRCIWPL